MGFCVRGALSLSGRATPPVRRAALGARRLISQNTIESARRAPSRAMRAAS
jgi:hypothetical protein